ncbi:nucleotidyltransferase [Rhizobium leguminosarum]|uniref:CBASS oligonucleotide cyclase n=1 Tax=Rhizobium leguminosarum TaxID=384 RepID=UPI001C95424C|nr:CBASS oligonucleotide cyclase [Rhizobium leguminosarum]MBY5786715.1 nucleotidyltransferase [Rhizobium leguminosarum]
MITTEEAFETYRKRLELSETERKNTIKRHEEVRGVIRGSYAVDRDILTGSYGRHTKTKPLKDVDVFFILNQKERDNYRNKAPSVLLDAFAKTLSDSYGKDSVEPGRRCATVFFERNTTDEEGKVLSIDAVPAFDIGDCYEIPDRVLGSWIKTDPEIHKQEATAKNNELGGNWVPLVKMIKRWNRSAGKPIKPSFLIEVMMQDLVDAPFTTYPQEVRRFFAAALNGIEQQWPDPAGYGPPVSDQMTPALIATAKEKLRQAEMKATVAIRREQQGRQSQAITAWREIMGKYFPAS